MSFSALLKINSHSDRIPPAAACLAALVLLGTSGCSPSTSPEPDTKRVALPSTMYYFTPDSASFAAIHSYRYTGSPALSDTAGLSKSAAKIDPAKIEVLVVWWSHDNVNWEAGYAYEQQFWSSQSRSRLRWQDQLDFYAGHPTFETVYHGSLERTGDYAEGDVLVRKGSNTVLIGFIDAQGMVPIEAMAYYDWLEDEQQHAGWYSPTGGLSDTLRF